VPSSCQRCRESPTLHNAHRFPRLSHSQTQHDPPSTAVILMWRPLQSLEVDVGMVQDMVKEATVSFKQQVSVTGVVPGVVYPTQQARLSCMLFGGTQLGSARVNIECKVIASNTIQHVISEIETKPYAACTLVPGKMHHPWQFPPEFAFVVLQLHTNYLICMSSTPQPFSCTGRP
jgi:hypothetical protein